MVRVTCLSPTKSYSYCSSTLAHLKILILQFSNSDPSTRSNHRANIQSNKQKPLRTVHQSYKIKRPLIREDLKVIQYQSQETDNTFITSNGTSPYNSMRKWAVKRHYREDNN